MSDEERPAPVVIRWRGEAEGVVIWSDETGRAVTLRALDEPPQASNRPPLYRLTRSDGRTIAGELWPMVARNLACRWIAGREPR